MKKGDKRFGKTAHNAIDMAGQVYNSWKILERVPWAPETKGGAWWVAECLECNEIYRVKGANIRRGLSKRCVKCGCGHGHAAQKGQVRTKRTAAQSAHHYLFLKLRKEARKRGLEWGLTPDQVQTLVLSNCAHCGAKPSLACKPLAHLGLSQKRAADATITRNGIDRLDPELGYTEQNCVPCCEICNTSKLAMSLPEWDAWFARRAAYLGYKLIK